MVVEKWKNQRSVQSKISVQPVYHKPLAKIMGFIFTINSNDVHDNKADEALSGWMMNEATSKYAIFVSQCIVL